MKTLRFALPLLLLPASNLLADALNRDDALKLPDVVISANRQVQARNDSSAANTVFTRDDIDRLQPSSVSDLLSRVPGVQVAQSGGRGSLPGIFIRGTKTAQSLVLVDGQRIANATSGDSGLQFLSVDQIERVEVLRGSRSVIYGSDAIGGVIQIFTRRNAQAGIHPRLHVGFGSNQTWERSLGLSGGDERTRFNLGASLDETQGINWTRESFATDGDHDAYRNKSLSLNLSHSLSDEVEVGFNLLDGRGKAEYDNPFGRSISWTDVVGQKPYTDYTVSSASGYVDAKLNERWKTRLEVGHSENRDKKRDYLSEYGRAFNTYRDSVNWQNDLTLTERNSLIVGGDWYEDRVHSSEDLEADSRWNRAVFIQHRFEADAFSTELGLRHDTNQQFGNQNTWSGTLTVPLNPNNEVLLSYSEGFRAPSFNDLYYPSSSNPNLKPEHSKSYELQWRSQLTDTTRLETSLYRTDLKDAIIAQPTDFYIPRNVASARINGVEAALKQELFGWQANWGLSIIDPRDRDSGHTLERRARRTLSLDLDRQFDKLGLGASWHAVSSSYDDTDNHDRLGGYALLGLRSSWAFTREVSVSLKVDNLLDRQYARARYSYNSPDFSNNHDYRDEGRTWMLGLTWTPQL